MNARCDHKWEFECVIESHIKKSAVFDIDQCSICKKFKMVQTDDSDGKVTISYHDKNPADFYFGTMIGYESFEYFEI
jgi:hypothetical protein